MLLFSQIYLENSEITDITRIIGKIYDNTEIEKSQKKEKLLQEFMTQLSSNPERFRQISFGLFQKHILKLNDIDYGTKNPPDWW